MDAIPASTTAFKFSDLADILSVIGFGITLIGLGLTIYVLLTIRKIKSYYVFKARVPDLLKAMSKHGSKLAQFHNDFENSKPQILLEVGQAEVTLKSLNAKVDKQIKISINEVAKQISDYKTYQEKSRAWNIYISLQKVNQEITNLQEDRKWESNNA
jgi:hypothetical protein